MMDPVRHLQPGIMTIEIKLPDSPESIILGNGVKLFLINKGTEDVLRADFFFRAGIIREFIPLLATTTNMMLQEGSQRYSAEELNSILDFYGVFQNLYVEKDYAGLKIFFLNKYIEKVLELACEMLFNPAFPEKELKVLMKKRLNWYKIANQKVQNLASDQFFESIFGTHHPYGRRVRENDFLEINTSLLREFHADCYRPEEMIIIISGHIQNNTATLFEKYFGRLKSEKSDRNIEEIFPEGINEKKKHIIKEDAIQTALRIGSATINKRHSDYHGFKIVNMILGGYFGSRLMKNLREEKGFTYGIHSSLSSLNLSGYKVISAETGQKYRVQAIDEIYKEIKHLQTHPVSNDELEIVRNYMLGELLRLFDGPFSLAESFKSLREFGLDYDYFNQFANKIRNITPDEIINLANTYYKIEDLYEITAG